MTTAAVATAIVTASFEWCTECEMSAPSAYDIDIEAGDIDDTDTVTVVWEIS